MGNINDHVARITATHEDPRKPLQAAAAAGPRGKKNRSKAGKKKHGLIPPTKGTAAAVKRPPAGK